MKRYDYDRITERMTETPAGDYVRHHEVKALLLSVERLVGCKGRFHTEQNFKALAEEWEKMKCEPTTSH